jgi:hypothetical protein
LRDVIIGLDQGRDIVDSELDDLAEKLDFNCDQYEDLPLKLMGKWKRCATDSTPSSRTRKEILTGSSFFSVML